MKYNNKIKISVFFTLFFLLFPPLYAGGQCCVDNNDAILPHVLSDSTVMQIQFDSRIFVTTDSGSDWRNITIGFSSYYYGYSINDKEEMENISDNIEKAANDEKRILSSVAELNSGFSGETINENSTISNQEEFGAAKVISYLVKITKYIKYNISNTGGKESVKISREKLTQALYNLRFNNTRLLKTFNYYKLENENGTFKKEWFS